ncbi:RAMP superfamily CRISPR-associated protein [Phormidium nigroviride]
MKVITFLLETQQPILATSFQGDPNSDVSFPYIPGSMIRGALIGRYLKRPPELPEDILSDADINKEVKRLFFDGNTRYLNAYIFCEKQTKRTLPVPLAWYKEKGDELPTPEETESLDIYDLSQYEPEQVSLKGLSEKFCTVNERQVVLYREKRRINIHTARDRTKGRSSPTKRDPATNQVIQEGEGAIFRYEALDVKQTFKGVILCKDEDAQTIESLLKPAYIWLGGSRSAGYGHIKIEIISPDKPQELDNWNEIQIKPEDRLNPKKLKITLLSDAILRDCCGQFSADPCLVKQAIEDKLKVQFPQATNVFISSTIVGGFNQKWGLPLPQVPALSAGSTFVFDSQLTTEQIKILEREGIGDRCIDGFGRVAVNWLGEYRKFSARPPESVRANETELDEKYHDLATQMAENILRQKLEQFLVEKISGINIQGGISNSQLSRLEIVARQGLTNPPSFLPLIELLSSLTSNAREQYRNTKVSGNKSLEQQLNDWLVKPIGNTDSWLKNPQDLEINIAGITRKIEPNSDLATEYTLRFIIAIAKKAKKEKNK